MSKRSMFDVRTGVLFCLFVVGMIAVLAIMPFQFGSQAQIKTGSGLFTRTESHDPGLPNYDIRDAMNTAKNEVLMEYFVSARGKVNRDAAVVADIRDGFVRGEEALKTRLPHVKFEYNSDIRAPEVITPDVWKSRIEWLSSPSTAKRSEVLRNFVKQNNELIGVNDQQADELKVLADYTNPDGNLSYAHLEQLINGVPVFRGEVKAGFTKDGRIIRVINNLAPGLDYSSLSTTFGDPSNAVRAAAGHINIDSQKIDTTVNSAASSDLKTVFGNGDSATTAEKMYFPTEPGVAVPAWRVLIWQKVNAYYIIVDAETGTMLWRKNITEDQTQTATYQVYNNANGFINAADSPAPLSPGPIDPTLGTQGALATRTNVTLIGNEGAYSFVNNGWITDGANSTDGNFNEAGIDRVAPDGVDAPQPGDGACPGAGCRVFSSTWNPPPGSPTPGDDPLTPQAQRGAVIQMFYVMNRYQSEMYRLGWTEQAFNFQNDNFGRGGAGVDRVRSEGQDSSGTNNANMSTPADGGRGRMQMFVWTGPTPDYDGTPDAEVIIHEVTHGLSNRLHGNAAGLSTNMARGMGEGWSDWYAETMLSEPSDPINGIYTTGGYATFLITAGFTGNYYYGIRRFPRAPITFTGGPLNRPHNPQTFRYINVGCASLYDGSTSAFPRGPIGSATCDQVHNIGEIFSSMLWEVRNRMVARLGHNAGTRRVLQVVTDGMKLAPTGPTILQERDAIVAAAAALPVAPEASADVLDVREGFRVRGAGFSASIQNAGTGANNTAVTEAFDVPNAIIQPGITVSDSTGDNDGFPEPGETLTVSVPIQNSSGGSIANVNGSITNGGTASYGTIADGATVVRNISYTVPGGEVCGSMHTITATGTSDLGALNPRQVSFRLGVPVGGTPVVASNTTSLSLPDGTGAAPAPASVYPSNVTVAGANAFTNAKLTLGLNGYTQTFPADNDFLLVGPGGQKFTVQSDQGGGNDIVGVSYSLNDGAAAALPTTLIAGTFRPTADATADIFPAPAPPAPYLLPAPGGAATFASTFGTGGAAMNGTWSLYIVDDAGGDTGTISGGWSLTVESNDFSCSVTPTAVKSRADFDGDGKTDMSVFRPSDGNWYLNRSTAGFGALNWGLSTDSLVPGDYDGDGKADTAVFRPDANPANADFFVLNSLGFTVSAFSWGSPADVPVSGDYDGDGKTDQAIFRPSNGTWYVRNSSNSSASVTPFGLTGDIPLAFDLENDGKTNLAVFRPSTNTWYIARNTGVPAQNFDAIQFGQAGDKLVPADYDGDNKDDVAVYRAGQWIIRRSSNGSVFFASFGNGTDVPVPGDYDGDGSDDIAIYRGGQWWLNRTTSGLAVVNFGLPTDTAIPAKYIP